MVRKLYKFVLLQKQKSLLRFLHNTKTSSIECTNIMILVFIFKHDSDEYLEILSDISIHNQTSYPSQYVLSKLS